MNRKLCDVLCCPRCLCDVDAASTALSCVSCGQSYPIVDGVPRMIVEDGIVPESRSRFDFQWATRLHGKAERRGTVYGYDIEKFMRWFDATYGAGALALQEDAWALDVGCGSAEKARALARRYPACDVIAMDQVDAIRSAAGDSANVSNLHFVQANAWYPPFKRERFAFVMSIGVLHHTPNTYRAFSAIAPLVAPAGRLAAWLYPLADEDSFWAGLYAQRDRHFLNMGHRLPEPLAMWLCRVYAAVFFPWILRFLMAEYRRNREQFPVYPDKRPSLRELFASTVFLTFDNVTPRHQHRHGRAEVRSWYEALGFGEIDSRFPGFFCGTKTACDAQVVKGRS